MPLIPDAQLKAGITPALLAQLVTMPFASHATEDSSLASSQYARPAVGGVFV